MILLKNLELMHVLVRQVFAILLLDIASHCHIYDLFLSSNIAVILEDKDLTSIRGNLYGPKKKNYPETSSI